MMKKLILGVGMLLSGVIGFVGWCVAVTQIVKPGARSSVFGCFDSSEWAVLILFVMMAVMGLVIAIREMENEK